MLKNYLKVALRNLLKHKVYSFINILGLAVGIAASVLISLYIFDELSYDRFHVNANRTYRVVADWSNKGDSRIHQLGTPSGPGQDHPGHVSAGRVARPDYGSHRGLRYKIQ